MVAVSVSLLAPAAIVVGCTDDGTGEAPGDLYGTPRPDSSVEDGGTVVTPTADAKPATDAVADAPRDTAVRRHAFRAMRATPVTAGMLSDGATEGSTSDATTSDGSTNDAGSDASFGRSGAARRRRDQGG